MKREMDLIRKLLLRIEAHKGDDVLWIKDEPSLVYHAELAHEAGLIQAVPTRNTDGRAVMLAVQKLTWAGHEFLDAARNETVWAKARDAIKQKGGSWTFDVLKALLTRYLGDLLLG